MTAIEQWGEKLRRAENGFPNLMLASLRKQDRTHFLKYSLPVAKAQPAGSSSSSGD
jgi:hypothetical protein